MEKQLEQIMNSYDYAIDIGRKGIDPYKKIPSYIMNDPDYHLYQKASQEGLLCDSGSFELKEFLAPQRGMKFVDLGCCLNLMLRNYDQWDSDYSGIDISPKTIELLEEYVKEKQIKVEALYCGSIHNTSFESNYFDLAACIGVFEYFEKEFIEVALAEMYRIIKANGKLVVDVPNIGNPICRIAMMLEDSLGRTDKYDLSADEFESMLSNKFEIIEKKSFEAMIQYYLRCQK